MSFYSRIAHEQSHFSSEVNKTKIDFDNPLGKQEIIDSTQSIGRTLVNTKKGNTTWISPQYILEANRYQLNPTNHTLFDGLGGIIIFLSALSKFIEYTEFDDLAEQSIKSLLSLCLEENLEKIKKININGTLGLTSSIYSLVKLSQLTADSSLLEQAQNLAVLIKSKLTTNDEPKFDIMFGYSGTILGFLALYENTNIVQVLEEAILCGNYLLNNSVISESGYRTWATLDGKILTGFSHGAAGIAYALLRLYKATGDTRFKEAAEEAIAYERSVFIPELNNWPDFRQPQTKDNPKCMCSWCHGAPGIGLARVATLDILDTPEIRQDIEAAITTTLNYGLSDIDHLCCGNMGRVEFLFTAGRKLNRPELVEAAMKLASQVVARAEQKGHYGYGTILDFHPGFFQGASGIGYQLLRLAYPDQLPSVLLWE
jgi:type 2 lantibiotic biosynthesis protein LanM